MKMDIHITNTQFIQYYKVTIYLCLCLKGLIIGSTDLYTNCSRRGLSLPIERGGGVISPLLFLNKNKFGGNYTLITSWGFKCPLSSCFSPLQLNSQFYGTFQ